MAESFFLNSAYAHVFEGMKDRKAKLAGFSPLSKLDRNAWVSIKTIKNSKGESVNWPIYNRGDSQVGKSSTTTNRHSLTGRGLVNPGIGKGNISLIDLQISLEGSAGSLRRATGKLVCPSMKQFNELEEKLLRPSTVIEIEYGHDGPMGQADGTISPLIFTVYDFSFILQNQNSIEVTFKAVGKGQEMLEANVFNASYVNPDGKKIFVADYNNFNEKRPVSSLFDLLDWMVQDQTGTLNSVAFSVPTETGYYYQGRTTEYRGQFRTGMDFCVMEAPQDYQPPGRQQVGKWRSDRITYYSLNFICWVINKYIVSPDDAPIICDGFVTHGHKGLDYDIKGSKFGVYSADPISVMLVRKSSGAYSYYNNYSDWNDRTDGDNLRFDLLDKNADAAIDNNYSDASFPELATRSDLSRILVSRDLLRSLGDTYVKSDSEGTSTSKVAVKRFFGDLFATIRDLTGEAVSLYLHQVDIMKPGMHVINKNTPPGSTPPKVVEFDPLPKDGKGDGITISIKMSGKVPKGVQAEAFGGTPSSGDKGKVINVAKDDDSVVDEVPKERGTLKKRLNEAFKMLAYKDFKTEVVTACKALLKELVDNESTKKTAANRTIPYPLEMDAILHGIEGFKFGDTVTSKYLPAIYQKTAGLRIAFTVTKINHRFQSQKWVTELTTTCRLVNN